MGEQWKFEHSDFGSRDELLVVVNHDYRRTYRAFMQSIFEADGTIRHTAVCQMKGITIVGVSSRRSRLSDRMNELATVIEEYTSPKLPTGVALGPDLHCAVN